MRNNKIYDQLRRYLKPEQIHELRKITMNKGDLTLLKPIQMIIETKQFNQVDRANVLYLFTLLIKNHFNVKERLHPQT